MDGFVYLIILYIIFSLVSSAFSKRKKALTAQKTQQVKSPPPLPKQEQRPISREGLDFQAPKDVLALDDDEIEPVEEFFPEPRLSEPPRPQKQAQPPIKTNVHRKRPGVLPRTSNQYLQGIILSEILGPPVSKRKKNLRSSQGSTPVLDEMPFQGGKDS